MRTFKTSVGEIELVGNVGECLDNFIREFGDNRNEELSDFLVAYELFKNAIKESDDCDDAMFVALEKIPLLKDAIEEIGKRIIMQ